MKQLLVLSGKGGTGKTTVSGALIALSSARAYADCDVDAPNLHLLFSAGQTPAHLDFYGMPKAAIDPARCTGCGVCMDHCRFSAITREGERLAVDPFACEGCGLCARLCPPGAVELRAVPAGDLMLYWSPARTFSTARLHMGSGTSGKLVTQVKSQLAANAPGDLPLAVIDGAPGVGCPVVASMSGVDLVLVVTEPSLSAMSDLERILRTAAQFGTPAAVCVNKHDANPENTRLIKAYCRTHQIPFVGEIPYDPMAVEAVNRGATIAEVPCPAGEAVRAIFRRVMELLDAPAAD